MKKILQTLLALSVFASCAAFVRAEPALKILVVDMAKLYDSHYKTEEQNAKLRGDEQKAQEELDRLNKEGNALVDRYKDLVEQSKNSTLTAEAKTKVETDAQNVLDDIRRKQGEVQNFQNTTRQSLQQRIKLFRDLMIEEISKIAVDIAKRRGATLLIDKSGPSLIGVSNILYSDAGYDITDEVMAEINKDRPAGTPAAAATSTTTTTTGSSQNSMSAPASTSDSPKITLPGAKK